MENGFEENFSNKQNVLSMRLQQRRPREILAEQGIIPPLNSPGTYFPQIQRLERARKEDFLNHAIQERPERDMLVQKHILEDSNSSSCILANQKELKKAKLVDDLNDKIALRPGVIELVERNIIPADETFQKAIKGGQIQYRKIADYGDEDSNEALSPEQLSSLTLSPPLFPISSSTPLSMSSVQSPTSFSSKNENSFNTRTSSSQSVFTQNNSHPYLSRQLSKGSKMGQSGLIPRMVTNARKKKDKPKFKKFKYHQYVPPDQQGKPDEKKTTILEDDSPYSRLLQQQQMYLQLQIMNNQFSNQRNGDSQYNTSFNHGNMVSPPPDTLTQTMKMEKPRNPNAPLTASKLDELKVSELKEELKQRGQKVTGTKEVLVERLRPYCVANDNAFRLSRCENGTLNFSLNSSMMAENSSDGLNSTSSTTSTPQTAFAIDPNIVHRHRVARMPAPQQHKVVLKQEKLTMPTWHHASENQAMTSPTPGTWNDGVFTRDKILEEQQKEINNLKRMLEMQRQQLHHNQFKQEPIQVMTKPLHTAQLSKTVFQFPTASHTDHVQNRTSTSQPPTRLQHAVHSKEVDPPNYEQAYEMMNGHKVVNNPPPNRQMEDYMEMYPGNPPRHRDPRTPPVARVLLNDHNSYYGINDHSTNHKPYPQHSDYVAQEHAQLHRDVRQNQINKMKQLEYANSIDYSENGPRPNLTKMLVESAGDALMDTSNFPPVINRYSNPNIDQYSIEHSRASARNSIDSSIMYSTSFSPMDTNNQEIGNRELLNDLRLSTSSLDSCEPTLNAVTASPATPPRARPSHNVFPQQFSSPRPINHNLIKSSSQELLSSDSPSSNADLGWLDLTLGSAMAAPPSPAGPFETMTLDDQNNVHQSRNSYPVSSHGSQDADLNLCLDTSSSNLGYPPSSIALGGQWDNWEGLLGSSFHS